jgi:Tol biopolymer transport system component
VKITPDGKVKVLDFGLAKVHESEQARTNLSHSPTLMTAGSIPGIIIGTAAYMSPEQAKGRPVDRRTDIFAFGCVVYEMLTGRPAFEGEDVTEILGRVVTAEPDFSLLPAETPTSVRRMLLRALKKDTRLRLSDIQDARIEIDETEPPAPAVPQSARGLRIPWWGFAAVILFAALLAIPTLTHLRETRPPEMRLEINTPSTPAPLHFALSPDGNHIVFVASGDGPQRLWLRALDKTDAQPLGGTEGAEYPFWSKDSRSIGFFASGKLYRMDIGGTQPQAVSDATVGRGGTWNADGAIVFAPTATSPLSRVAASGGDAVIITNYDSAPGVSHRYPQFLPDGRHFLFYLQGTPQTQGIYLASLDGSRPKRLTAADTAGAYLKPDRVVYVRQGALVARQLDLTSGEWKGEPVTLADRVADDPTFNLGAFSISDDGRIAYRADTAGRRQLTWHDRTGKAIGVAGEPDTNGLLYPELSPDGRQVAVMRNIQNNQDLWLMNLLLGGFTRLTTNPAVDNCPVWSPDGTRIAYSSNRGAGNYNIYTIPAGGGGPEELRLESPNFKIMQDWSKDGRYLLYFEGDPKTGRDLWTLDMTVKDAKPRVVVNTLFEESLAQFSPDAKWVAYQTNESGRFEIMVQAFPEPHGRSPVSTNGGIEPRWRSDGKELYFIAPDGKLMAASVSTSGTTFQSEPAAALFQTHMAGGAVNLFRPQYAVARDGRFLINQLAEESSETPITLILNWAPERGK